MPSKKPIPIIDLFAGPGGLGEGFSSVFDSKGNRRFEIKLSVEKDAVAHKTLSLRAFYRCFSPDEVPDDYYSYLRGEITRDKLEERYPKEWKDAYHEAKCLTLGKDDIAKEIDKRLPKRAKNWVLIGGPPCQAYSLVGRATMSGKGTKREGESDEDFETRATEKKQKFESDHRHTLYKEYLKVIAHRWPAVFVMENVKGILSAKYKGERIFPRILEDLANPGAVFGEKEKYRYQIRSFVVNSSGRIEGELDDRDFLIKAEKYGIPQTRHRVILLGVREDISADDFQVLEEQVSPTVGETIGLLPKLRSAYSAKDFGSPREALRDLFSQPWFNELHYDERYQAVFDLMVKKAEEKLSKKSRLNRGANFVSFSKKKGDSYFDDKLGGVCNHETRSHMKTDLWRYFYNACFAEIYGCSAHLRDFPEPLLPAHKNAKEAVKGIKFGDRFRVQVKSGPSSTIISHISKDGHYFIHYDPLQNRSLTVREAARLQTFPDNYFFEGPRTQQFHQVGNAVPPALALNIAKVVADII